MKFNLLYTKIMGEGEDQEIPKNITPINLNQPQNQVQNEQPDEPSKNDINTLDLNNQDKQDNNKTLPAFEKPKIEIDPIEEKLKLIAIKIYDELNTFLKDKPDLVISKITDRGMDNTLADFIDNYYVKIILKDPISKLYVIVNKKALINKIIEKFSDELKKKDFEKNSD